MTRPEAHILDAIEDGVARLERDDGVTMTVPAQWLPQGASEGEMVTILVEHTGAGSSRITFDIAQGASSDRRDRADATRERLDRAPDGDIEL